MNIFDTNNAFLLTNGGLSGIPAIIFLFVAFVFFRYVIKSGGIMKLAAIVFLLLLVLALLDILPSATVDHNGQVHTNLVPWRK